MKLCASSSHTSNWFRVQMTAMQILATNTLHSCHNIHTTFHQQHCGTNCTKTIISERVPYLDEIISKKLRKLRVNDDVTYNIIRRLRWKKWQASCQFNPAHKLKELKMFINGTEMREMEHILVCKKIKQQIKQQTLMILCWLIIHENNLD